MGSEGGGGWIDGSSVDFSRTPLSNGEGLRGTSRREQGQRRWRSEEKGCFNSRFSSHQDRGPSQSLTLELTLH